MISGRKKTVIFFLFICLMLAITQIGFAEDSKTIKKEDYVTINFNDVDISVFVKFISEITGKNFIIDKRVKGKVSIISPGKISKGEVYKVFQSVLDIHGFAAVDSGEVVKIIPTADARSKSRVIKLKEEAGKPEDKVVTQLLQLKYADPANIKKLLLPLLSKSSVMLAYQPTNSLIITDLYSNITRIQKIIKAIDIPGIGMEVSIIPLENANASKFVKILSTVFKTSPGSKKTPTSQRAQFVADERTNSIIARASTDDIERVNSLISLLDKEIPRGGEKIHVYYLENATAEDLAKVLNSIVGNKAATKTEDGKRTAPVVSGSVNITPDKDTNSLIIMADKNDYLVLADVIKKLDIPRTMVYVECLIMEVSLEKDFNLGTEWTIGDKGTANGNDFYYGGGFSDDWTTSPLLGDSLLSATGLSLGILGEAITIGSGTSKLTLPGISAVVNMYKTDKDVNILSTPQILTTDNQKATIHVGENRPYMTKQETGSGEDDKIFNSFEYKDVGVTLSVTPQINRFGNEKKVQLLIEQSITRLDTASTFSVATPVTFKRTLDTTVIVENNNTVVMGGLIDETMSVNVKGVPVLSKIPVLGWLFKNKGKATIKRNLYIFLTPHIIETSHEGDKMFEKKKLQIEDLRRDSIKMYGKWSEGMLETEDSKDQPNE